MKNMFIIAVVQIATANQGTTRRLLELEIPMYLRDEDGVHAFEMCSDATGADLYSHGILNRTGNDNRFVWNNADVPNDETPLSDLGIGAEALLTMRHKELDSVALFSMLQNVGGHGHFLHDQLLPKLQSCFDTPTQPECSTDNLCQWVKEISESEFIDLYFISCSDDNHVIEGVLLDGSYGDTGQYEGEIALQFVPESVVT